MTSNRKLFYFSTVRGVTEQEDNEDTVYYGCIIRTPRGMIGGAMHQETVERTIDNIKRRIEHNGAIQTGCLEVYEIFDFETEDVITMFRAPYQKIHKTSYRLDELDTWH